MLNQQIAEAIRSKVGSLVGRPLSVTESDGAVLASDLPDKPESIDLADVPWSIAFSYGGKTAGWVVLEEGMENQDEISPLIRSIAELVMHQSILISQIPHEEERLDKFVYELLYQPQYDPGLLSAEAKLFNLDIDRPRIAIAIRINDPILALSGQDPSSDRELRLSRYKFGINRALNSFYTGSRENVVAYLGENLFVILKDLLNGTSDLGQSVENFKRSLGPVHDILKGEIKQPATIGVGNYHPGLDGLRQSFQEALSAIELGLQNWDGERIYHIDDFGVVAPLLSGVDEHNIYFSRELLDRLGENAEIIQTLETFFNYDMSLTRTADALGIHRNTLVYRLDRIHELLGLDPRAFDDAVQVKLAILYNKFVGVRSEA
jgi:carbohydrate diacid regulator